MCRCVCMRVRVSVSFLLLDELSEFLLDVPIKRKIHLNPVDIALLV